MAQQIPRFSAREDSVRPLPRIGRFGADAHLPVQVRAGHKTRRANPPDDLPSSDALPDSDENLALVKVQADHTSAVIDASQSPEAVVTEVKEKLKHWLQTRNTA